MFLCEHQRLQTVLHASPSLSQNIRAKHQSVICMLSAARRWDGAGMASPLPWQQPRAVSQLPWFWWRMQSDSTERNLVWRASWRKQK